MGKGLAGRTVWGCSFAAVLLCILMYSLVPTVMAADHTITFVNNCNETIWPGEGGPHPTGWEMAAGATVVKTIPVGTAGLTFWGRTGCTFNESGKCPTQGVDCCKSGGCISSADTTYFGLECASGGQPPVALFEPTFDANSPHGPLDYFDVSLIDGFSHVAIQVTP
ncbi:MAG TPA: thaumatin family protein, partial [Syntrophorhabdaceae bacterium]